MIRQTNSNENNNYHNDKKLIIIIMIRQTNIYRHCIPQEHCDQLIVRKGHLVKDDDGDDDDDDGDDDDEEEEDYDDGDYALDEHGK